MKRRFIALFLIASVVFCSVPNIAWATEKRNTSLENSLAEDLKALGLFKGVSETNFDLDRAPSRIEALIMLIRLLGSEEAALSQHTAHPFTDVPEWASDYVGYAYTNHLANGISSTEFGNGAATSAMYLTFVLRALGYSDINCADFSWNNPYDLAKSIGVLPDSVDISNFWRADAVTISYSALQAKLKSSDRTLANRLIEDSVFTKSQFEAICPPSPSVPLEQGDQSEHIDNSESEASASTDTELASGAKEDMDSSGIPSPETPGNPDSAEKDETTHQPKPDDTEVPTTPPVTQPSDYKKPDWLYEPNDKPENDNPPYSEKPAWLYEPNDKSENDDSPYSEKPAWLYKPNDKSE